MSTQPPHIQRIVPCECGSHEAYWHGPSNGLREYSCDRCWHTKQAIECLHSSHVQDNKHRLGILGNQDIDRALEYLKTTIP